MVGVIFMVGWLTARVFGGEASDFILEIPPMRRPQLANVLVKTAGRLKWYLREVIPLFVLGTAVLFLLDKLAPARVDLARLGEPLVTGWLGLPKEMANAFLIGFMRRDFGAVYLLDAATGPDPVLERRPDPGGDGHDHAVHAVHRQLPDDRQGARHEGRLGMAAFIFPFAFLVGGLVHFAAIWLFT